MKRVTLANRLRQFSKTIPTRDRLPRTDLAVNRRACIHFCCDSSGFSLNEFQRPPEKDAARTVHSRPEDGRVIHCPQEVRQTVWRLHVSHN